MIPLLKIYPFPNTVQDVARFLVDSNETGRLEYYALTAALLFIMVSLAVTANAGPLEPRQSFLKRLLLSDVLYFVLIVSFVLRSRIPFAVLGILNPDEPFWVADAKTLWYDLRPWLSVDTGTGGPLVPISLLALKIFGLPIDAGSMKIMAGAVIGISTGFVYLAGCQVIGSNLSKVLILPVAVALSTVSDWDYLAYNSEHPTILIISVSLFFLGRCYSRGAGKYFHNLIFLGLFLGIVPHSKVQGVPMALFLGLTGCYLAFKAAGVKQLLILVISALVPTAIFMLALASYGGIEGFWITSVSQNLAYKGTGPGTGSSLISKVSLLFQILDAGEMVFFFRFSFSLALLGLLSLALFWPAVPQSSRGKVLFAVLFLLVSFYCITAPGRPFVHYGLLSVFPIVILCAVLVASFLQAAHHYLKEHGEGLLRIMQFLLVTLFIGSSSIYSYWKHFTSEPEFLAKAKERYWGFCPQGPVSIVLDHYHSPRTRLATWAYEPELFEGTDFLMGTRFPATAWGVIDPALVTRYLQLYLGDMERNKPKLFVYPDRRTQDHFKEFPEVANYIKDHYTLRSEAEGYHIYVRNDSIGLDKPWSYRRKIGSHVTGEFHAHFTTFAKDGTFIKFEGWTVLGEDVTEQKVSLALLNSTDTVLVEAFQKPDPSVAEFAKKPGYIMSGFIGFAPLEELGAGDYQVALFVENKELVGFKMMGTSVNKDLLPQP